MGCIVALCRWIRDTCCGCRRSAAPSPQTIYEELCEQARPVIHGGFQFDEEKVRRLCLSYFDPQTRSSDGTVERGKWERWLSNHISAHFPVDHQRSAIEKLTDLNYNDNARCYPVDGHVEQGA